MHLLLLQDKCAMSEAMVTSESAPMSKGPGNELVGGTVNSGNAVLMHGSSVSADTVLSSITRLIFNTQLSRRQCRPSPNAASSCL